jgi:hypothetical protein
LWARNHRLVSVLEWSAMPSRLIDDERDEVSLFRGCGAQRVESSSIPGGYYEYCGYSWILLDTDENYNLGALAARDGDTNNVGLMEKLATAISDSGRGRYLDGEIPNKNLLSRISAHHYRSNRCTCVEANKIDSLSIPTSALCKAAIPPLPT